MFILHVILLRTLTTTTHFETLPARRTQILENFLKVIFFRTTIGYIQADKFSEI